MGTTRLESDLFINGNISAKSANLPAGSVTDAAIAANAKVAADKLRRRLAKHFTQAHGSVATAERRVIHTVRGAVAEIVAFRCGVVVACLGDATITIDLLKNGSTVLSATTVLDSSNTAFTLEAAAGFTSTSLAANDVLEVNVTVNAGTGTLGEGLFCELTADEDAS